MAAQQLVVISGLPASGKTTLGRALARRLALPLLDKDDILEGLFDSLGCDDREQRQRLSRASDDVLFGVARTAGCAVLVNWWDHDAAPARLRAISESIVEVHCECAVELAAERFAARSRHPGHLDRLITADEREAGMRRLRDGYRGPVLGSKDRLVTVDTSHPVDVELLAERISVALVSSDDTKSTLSG